MAAAFHTSVELLLAAVSEGTPPFIGNDVASSSPSRGAPYLVDFSMLATVFGTTPTRRRLIGTLMTTRSSLAKHCKVHAVLIGGSLTRLTKTEPRDCDAVFFYEISESSDASAKVEAMSIIAKSARLDGLDLRLVPTDADPVSLIKARCYFTLLFASERGGCLPKFGSLLVTCD